MRRIVYSKIAKEKLIDLLEFLEVRWSIKTRDKFIKKLDFVINLLETDPEIFPKSEINSKQHKCVVTKQTTIYYRFNDKQIRILSIFDTRQNPSKIKIIK